VPNHTHDYPPQWDEPDAHYWQVCDHCLHEWDGDTLHDACPKCASEDIRDVTKAVLQQFKDEADYEKHI
jgi:Zn finger protein HypA/HybF involved in hydrogenase expression